MLALILLLLAAPRVPSSDGEILERLRTTAEDPGLAALRKQRAELSQHPENLQLASSTARAYLERGSIEGDPRFTGRAQAALAPWWSSADAPEPVLVLRAIIRQRSHDFAPAVEDLQRALLKDPKDGQAWLTLSSVQAVSGDLEAAKKSCGRLFGLASHLVSFGCLAPLSGDYHLLARLLEADGAGSPGEEQWARALVAELAARAGETQTAEAAYRRALEVDAPSAYVLGSYADFLLDQKRPAEVVALLRDRTRVDPLLLRLALAEQQLRAPELAAHVAALRDRFAASRQRGDVVHRREEAIFQLQLEHDAKTALRLARDNFGVQHEPADVRILIEAAQAAGDAAAAQPALEFARKAGWSRS